MRAALGFSLVIIGIFGLAFSLVWLEIGLSSTALNCKLAAGVSVGAIVLGVVMRLCAKTEKKSRRREDREEADEEEDY